MKWVFTSDDSKLSTTMNDMMSRSAPRPQDLVDMPTPADRFFTPERGWPEAPRDVGDDWVAPSPVMCLADQDNAELFPSEKPIGILRIEVLQAEGLPRLKRKLHVGRVDPYVQVLFDSYAARTSTMWNVHDPTWGVDDPRGFMFPITCPYSAVYLAVKDKDPHWSDDIGRVAINLGLLRARVVYDAWFPLQSNVLVRHKGRRGKLRVRFSVEFANERLRLTRYLTPQPTFYAPFDDEAGRGDASFAYHGRTVCTHTHSAPQPTNNAHGLALVLSRARAI